MASNRAAQRTALQGSQRLTSRLRATGEPKIGVDELMSVIERFGVSRAGLKQIRAIAEREDINPMLANYYSGLKETKVQAFEREARKFFGVKHALAVSSGTGALHSAFVAIGVGPGTEVICPAIGFFATAAAVVAANGVPVFCDVDESLHMDPAKIAPLISARTVAIAPTHVMGGVADMARIMAVARKHKLKVVEDCAQSCGASFHDRPVGTIGDLGCFSISAYKIVGGGEGGLVITNNRRLWERANGIAECGGLWRPDRFAPPRYAGELFCGTNYRLSELEAAVDVVQMRKAAAVVRRFRRVRQRVVSRLRAFEGITPQPVNDPKGQVGYMLRFFPETEQLGLRVMEALQEEGIACYMRGKGAKPDWHIYHDMMPLVRLGTATADACSFACPRYAGGTATATYRKGACPVADDLYSRMLAIGLNQWFTASDCRRLSDGINRALAKHCRQLTEGKSWQ